jgi:murein L,D-transpeptidase YafK
VNYGVIFPCDDFAIILHQKEKHKLEVWKAKTKDTIKPVGEEE